MDYLRKPAGASIDWSAVGPAGSVHFRGLGDCDAILVQERDTVADAFDPFLARVAGCECVRRTSVLPGVSGSEPWNEFAGAHDAPAFLVGSLRIGYHVLASSPLGLIQAVHRLVSERVAAADVRALIAISPGTSDIVVLLRARRFHEVIDVFRGLRGATLHDGLRQAGPGDTGWKGHLEDLSDRRSEGHLFVGAQATAGYDPAGGPVLESDRARLWVQIATYPGHEAEVASLLLPQAGDGVGTSPGPSAVAGRYSVTLGGLTPAVGCGVIERLIEQGAEWERRGGRFPVLWSHTVVSVPISASDDAMASAPLRPPDPVNRPPHPAPRAVSYIGSWRQDLSKCERSGLLRGSERKQVEDIYSLYHRLLTDVARQQCYLDLAPPLRALTDRLGRVSHEYSTLMSAGRLAHAVALRARAVEQLGRVLQVLATCAHSRAAGDFLAAATHAPQVAEATVSKTIQFFAWISLAVERVSAPETGRSTGALLLLALDDKTRVEAFVDAVLGVSLGADTLRNPLRGVPKLVHDLGHHQNLFLHGRSGVITRELIFDCAARAVVLRAQGEVCGLLRPNEDPEAKLRIGRAKMRSKDHPNDDAFLQLAEPGAREAMRRYVRAAMIDRAACALDAFDAGADQHSAAGLMRNLLWMLTAGEWAPPKGVATQHHFPGAETALRALATREFLADAVGRAFELLEELLCDLHAASMLGRDVYREFAQAEAAEQDHDIVRSRMRFVAALLDPRSWHEAAEIGDGDAEFKDMAYVFAPVVAMQKGEAPLADGARLPADDIRRLFPGAGKGAFGRRATETAWQAVLHGWAGFLTEFAVPRASGDGPDDATLP